MIIKYTRIVEFLKTVKPKDLVYSGILVLFIVTVGIVFFISTQFISKNINKIFSSESGEVVQVLDITRYELALKKLGVTATLQSEGTTIESDNINAGVATSTKTTDVMAPAPLNKGEVTITVLNSTPKAGLASLLAKTIEQAGFNTPKTGNQKIKLSTTTIIIKESKAGYLPSITEAVHTLYPSAITTTAGTSKETDSDIIIIIGEY